MANEEKHRGREMLELVTRDEFEDNHGSEGYDKEAEDNEVVDAVKNDAVRLLVTRLQVMEHDYNGLTFLSYVIQCCICQDLVDARKQGHLSNCAHQFHYHCIVAWAKVTNLCPLCKTKFHAVTRHDAHGALVHREVIEDVTQVYRPDPLDHDLAAQLRLVNQARCELCGSGEDEHVLLLCEAVGCGVASHTYCIGLRAVPNTSWYCSTHATSQDRASDAIERPATTVTTRRRTRRLANLMSNVLRGRSALAVTRSRRRGPQGFVAVGEAEERRPVQGIAAAYALRMSRELMQVQLRADAMFARGDLTQSSLYGQSNGSLTNTGTRAPGPSAMSSTIDQMWEDNARGRQELAAAAIATRDSGLLQHSGNSRSCQRSNIVSSSFAPEYCALAKLMQDAVNSDNYASSVALLIPKTAKLRLVSRAKTFFGRLTQKEKVAALELGCLSVLHDWIRVPRQELNNTQYSPNSQVLATSIAILETLPIRQEDLVEEASLQSTLDCLSELSNLTIEMRQRIIDLSEKWRDVNPPVLNESPRPQVAQQVPPPDHATHPLPVIEAFTAPKRVSQKEGKRKRKREAWSKTVVDYAKAKLYPLYKQSGGSGKLTRDRFKVIVKEVAALFSHEAASMQSAVLLPTGDLSNLAKSRIKKLIDQVYKTSTNDATSRLGIPLLMHAVPTSTYSAVPSVKHHRQI